MDAFQPVSRNRCSENSPAGALTRRAAPPYSKDNTTNEHPRRVLKKP
ncbi:hypothetical protein D3OALGA1CA_5342 [Olavius algarvensis associated proteobacterium Delta 3]|nr:hypothetical protein D3OALGB2SA_4941 [Olavius algarvensis associated proteobacterium Delta 3]CAB5165317.1 hypothetical protein D3OALGA1CA_5342 [Olavius algarvensis associated proteobacterium Delta 3]